MKKVIIVESDTATGEVSIEAIGFKGGACTAATEALERALGTVKDRRKKPEFNASGTVAPKQQIGGAK